MIAELGSFGLILALSLSLLQFGLSIAGRLTQAPILKGAGEGAAKAAFFANLLAFGCLILAFVVSDFSVKLVAEHSHTEKPLLYKVAGAWGNHEGSLLLWCLALTGFGALIARAKRLPEDLKATTVAVQGGLGALFLGFAVLSSNPFVRLLDVPVEGKSLNPLLQDPALAFHPPFLYLGYVGFSVVFSFAVAALIEGRVDQAFARWVRPWSLAAWALLTVGITLGAFWAYYELGWGGWWFWDPVENASFMPWLAGTALLHSAIVTERRGALPGWTVFLSLIAFTFSMLGAFLVRSGVLTSVHAFAVDPKRGILLLLILGVAAGLAFALFAWRAPSLNRGGAFAPISRESALVLNNLFLSAALATVFLGTLYPLLIEALTKKPISVGAPFFDMTFAPLMGLGLIALPFGTLLPWKRGDLLGVGQKLMMAGLGALACAVLIFGLYHFEKLSLALGCGIGLYLILGVLAELFERVRLFAVSGQEVLRRLKAQPLGTWGMSLAHLGLGLFILGAVVETQTKVEAARTLSEGQGIEVGAYHLVLKGVGGVDGPNYMAERGEIAVTKAGKEVCQAQPERRFYPAGGQSTTEVALCFTPLSDLYIVLGERRVGSDGNAAWLVRTYWNPMARLIFFGPLLMALGGLLSLLDRRLRVVAGTKAYKNQDDAQRSLGQNPPLLEATPHV